MLSSRAAVSLALVAVLLALSAFICSPWHRHSRLSGQACSFAPFEHAPSLQAAAHAPLAPPAVVTRHETRQQATYARLAHATTHLGRAPPA